MTERYDADTSEQLALDIAAFSKNDHTTPEEAMMATMGACASVIASIECSGCRKAAAESALQSFPKIVADALKFAADKFGDAPPYDHQH